MSDFQKHPALDSIQGKSEKTNQEGSPEREQEIIQRIIQRNRDKSKAESWDSLMTILQALFASFVFYCLVHILVSIFL